MLLDSHHLNTVVSVFNNSRQHILCELLICTNFLSILSHTHVAFIYEQRTLIGLESLLLELVRFLGSPHLSRENLCGVILNHAATPCRYSLPFSTIPFHLHLIKVAMLHSLGG